MFAAAALSDDRGEPRAPAIKHVTEWADRMLAEFDERFGRVKEEPVREREAQLVEAAANVDLAKARSLVVGFQTNAQAAAFTLAQTATDLDAAQARLLEITEQVNSIGSGNAQECKALTDVATSLGDISVVCNRAAKEARR